MDRHVLNRGSLTEALQQSTPLCASRHRQGLWPGLYIKMYSTLSAHFASSRYVCLISSLWLAPRSVPSQPGQVVAGFPYKFDRVAAVSVLEMASTRGPWTRPWFWSWTAAHIRRLSPLCFLAGILFVPCPFELPGTKRTYILFQTWGAHCNFLGPVYCRNASSRGLFGGKCSPAALTVNKEAIIVSEASVILSYCNAVFCREDFSPTYDVIFRKCRLHVCVRRPQVGRHNIVIRLSPSRGRKVFFYAEMPPWTHQPS